MFDSGCKRCNAIQRLSMNRKGNCTFLGILGRHGGVFVVLVVVGAAGEKSTMEILTIKNESAICACLVRAYGKPRDTLTSTGSFRGP
jgi:hypothetical protein